MQDKGVVDTAGQSIPAWLQGMIEKRRDDGAVVSVPVEGGVFRHPLTGQRVERLKGYIVGGRLKLFEPRFLYSLPPVELAGTSGPAQFCARVAGVLGDRLGQLGSLRDEISARGLAVDLQHDALLLRGENRVGPNLFRVAAWRPGQIVIEMVNGRELGHLPPGPRTLHLSRQPQQDYRQLVQLLALLSPTAAANEAESGEEEESVVELTEAVTEAELVPPNEHQAARDPLPLSLILSKLGSNVEVASTGGALRFSGSLKLVAGRYAFELEQVSGREVKGHFTTPSGNVVPVKLVLDEIMDMAQVIEDYLNGR
ncbi:MAG: hypothetical protein D6806_15910 [Deltaproteobacteria bacterium]|nr:MAG: hypothetical protein D6806_15910 [Deltaproteobacteria bacterium]